MEDRGPTSVEIRQQLAKILASPEFLNAARLRRFLEYVVEETLAGRAEKIKAYTIALAVLNRNDTFDPQVDPVVRIEAGRLRRALDRYYIGGGQQDTVGIQIPKGAYVPRFSFRDSSAERQLNTAGADRRAPWSATRRKVVAPMVALLSLVVLGALLASWLKSGPAAIEHGPTGLQSASLLMLPLSTTDGDRVFSEGFTADVLAALSRYTEIFVFAPETSFRIEPTSDVRQLAETYGTRYVLLGTLARSEHTIHIGLQLLEAASARVVWADSFSIEQTASSVFAAQSSIADQVVRQIAEPYGAMGSADFAATRGKPPSSMSSYECVLQAYDYRRRFDLSGFEETQACLMRAVRENPTYADAWAMLALLYVDQSRFSPVESDPSETMDLALEAAERAVQFGPASAAARRALISVHFLRQEPEKGFSEGERALALNPNSAEVLFELGLRHVMSGDVERGAQLLNRASVHNPAAPETYDLGLALAHFRKGEIGKALATFKKVAVRPNFVYWAIGLAILGKAGSRAEAEVARTELLKLYPDFPQAAMHEMRRRSIAPDLVTALLDGWRMAGLEVVTQPNNR